MANVFKVVPSGIASFSAVPEDEAATVAAAASVDYTALTHLLIGAAYGGFGVSSGLTQAALEAADNCFYSANQVAGLLAAIGGAADASASAIVRADNA